METPQADQVHDAAFAEQCAREAREREEAEAAAAARRQVLMTVAEDKVPQLSPATVLLAYERGEALSAWYPIQARKLDTLAEELAAREQAFEARMAGRGSIDVYQRGKFAEEIASLRAALKDAREMVQACAAVARARVDAVLKGLVQEQVRQRNVVLAKAVPFEERIRQFERMRSHFEVTTMTSEVVGVSRWIRR